MVVTVCFVVWFDLDDLYYQYYFNKKGNPIGADEIVDQLTYSTKYYMHSFYYQYSLYCVLWNSRVINNCTTVESGFICDSVIDSVWFKILNTTSTKDLVKRCDPIFIKKYSDIT